MAARSLRHLIGDATLAGVQTRPLAHIGHRAIAAQGGQGLPASLTPPSWYPPFGALICWASKPLGGQTFPAPATRPGWPPDRAVRIRAATFPPCFRHVSAMFPPYGARAGA